MAKEELEQTANASAKKIQGIAQQQMEAYHQELSQRFQEIEDEIEGLPPLENQAEIVARIDEGVQEASNEIVEETAQRGELYDEIWDEI
ncbi:hypothetical protein V8E51_011783 [Hyaloscypha variabilis]